MPEEPKRLKLSLHAAVAVQGAVNERNQIVNAMRQKDAEITRLTDMLMAEAEVDTEQWRCKGVELLRGETFLTLEPIPTPQPPAQAGEPHGMAL